MNDTTSGNNFTGFCVDILLELANRLNFSFEIEIVKDKTFGKKNEKGEWNGIIGELVNRVRRISWRYIRALYFLHREPIWV